MRLSIFALCFALSTSFAAQPEVVPDDAGPLNPTAAEAGKDVVHQLNNAFAKVFETVAPGVVIIETSKKSEISESSPLDDLLFQGPPDDNNRRKNPGSLRPIQSEGSGFIVRPDGYIFTNFHVVEGANKIDVKLQDGRGFPAKVIGTDEKTDVAVIKIDAKDLPVVQLGEPSHAIDDLTQAVQLNPKYAAALVDRLPPTVDEVLLQGDLTIEVPAENVDAMRDIRQSTRTPVCSKACVKSQSTTACNWRSSGGGSSTFAAGAAGASGSAGVV